MKVDTFRLILLTACTPLTVISLLLQLITEDLHCPLLVNLFIKLFQITALGDQYISEGEKIYEAKQTELIGKD
jgi:hypothetical protein